MSTRIVILDGYTLNPGDLDWGPIERFGDLMVYERTAESQVVERAANAEIVLTNKSVLSAENLKQLPQLKYIGVLATGYNVVDVKAASDLGIVVSNVPDYSTNSVAQLVFALLLEHCNHVQAHSDAVHAGEWGRCADFTFRSFPLMELAGKTMGIIGFGQTGQQVARLALAFGMKVVIQSRTPKQIPGLEQVQFLSREQLLTESDVITLHCPLTSDTEKMINRDTLSLMKQTAFFINIARGGLMVEQDVAHALAAGTISGAGIDVLSTEPPAIDNPLIGAPNCWITPHIAWSTVEARARLISIAADNLGAFIAGKPIHVVSY
jgi:glycerate dehydrogenase